MEYGVENKEDAASSVKLKKETAHQAEPMTQPYQLQNIFQEAGSPPDSPPISPLVVSAPCESNRAYAHNVRRGGHINPPSSTPGSRGRAKNNFSDSNYPSTPEMARYQPHIMDSSYLDKQHLKKIRETQIKLKEQQLKIRMKDQEMATMIIQVAGLQSDLRVKTMAVRNIKAEIMNQRHYLHDILEETNYLRSDNVSMIRAVQELENLKKVNKEQKGRAHELTPFYEKRKELVKQIKEAELKNKLLNQMVQASILHKHKGTDAPDAREPSQFFPSAKSQVKSSNAADSTKVLEAPAFYPSERASPQKNQLNPNAVTFVSDYDEKSCASGQQANMESLTPKSKKDNTSQSGKLCANEMKRKFAEALRGDQGDASWAVEASLIFGRFGDGTVGVKVELHVIIETEYEALPAEEVVFPYNSSQGFPLLDPGVEQP